MSKRIQLKFKKMLKKAEFVHADLEYHEELVFEAKADFNEALIGVKRLPYSSRGGVYLAYVYYKSLFNKIKNISANKILTERVRISNGAKFGLMLNSMVQHKMNIL